MAASRQFTFTDFRRPLLPFPQTVWPPRYAAQLAVAVAETFRPLLGAVQNVQKQDMVGEDPEMTKSCFRGTQSHAASLSSGSAVTSPWVAARSRTG